MSNTRIQNRNMISFYKKCKEEIKKRGFRNELEDVENRSLDDIDAQYFFEQYVYVVLSAGMKNQVAEQIFQEAFKEGLDTIGHERKRKAVKEGVKKYRKWYQELLDKPSKNDKLDFLQTLPWIGPVTKYHLARNIGIDVAKPDRHLTDAAKRHGYDDVQKFCKDISEKTGDRIGTVDYVIWRYYNLGLHKNDDKNRMR